MRNSDLVKDLPFLIRNPIMVMTAAINSEDRMRTRTRVEQLTLVRAWAKSGRARELRLDAGLSLEELAAEIGVTAGALSRWERGERRCTGEPAVRWATALTRLQRVAA